MSECGCPTCVTRRIEKGLDKIGFGFEKGYSDACSDDGTFQVQLRHENVRVEVLIWVRNCPNGRMHVGLRRGKATKVQIILYLRFLLFETSDGKRGIKSIDSE